MGVVMTSEIIQTLLTTMFFYTRSRTHLIFLHSCSMYMHIYKEYCDREMENRVKFSSAWFELMWILTCYCLPWCVNHEYVNRESWIRESWIRESWIRESWIRQSWIRESSMRESWMCKCWNCDSWISDSCMHESVSCECIYPSLINGWIVNSWMICKSTPYFPLFQL